MAKSEFTAAVAAAAVRAKVATMNTAGEGGAWGIALLASYTSDYAKIETLEDYLEKVAFKSAEMTVTEPDEDILKGFDKYIQAYKKLLLVERATTDNI